MSNKQQLITESDENLLLLFAKSNEKEALGVLFQRHMASAYHLAYKYMRNQADAEDAVQKAFINVMRYASDQNQPGMVKAWIMKTVINVCKNEITLLVKTRERYLKKEVQNTEVSPDQNSNQEELRSALVTAIEQLPEHFRIPIWLNHYENMSIKEISVSLGKPEKTIRTQIARGLEKLQLVLSGKSTIINSITIIALLAECKKEEKVPVLLIEKINAISNLNDSSRLTVQTLKNKSLISQFAFPIIGLSAIVMIGFLYFNTKNNNNNNYPNSITKNAISNNAAESLNLSYNFSLNNYPPWISIVSGNPILIKENIGNQENQFIQVDTKEDFILKLNIPLQKKPIKVSYDLKAIGRSSNTFDFHSLLPKVKQKGSVTFSFNSKFNTNEWNHIDIVLQNNIETFYCNGKLLMVMVLTEAYESDLSIIFKNVNVNIDNIKLISGSDIKVVDYSRCIEIANELRVKPGLNFESIDSPLPNFYQGPVKVYWGDKN